MIAPYRAEHVPPPNLANTARIDSLIRDGRIYLSINDAIALTLENNLDIVLARYNLNIADTDVLRAKAGSNILGVNTGIVQNTPGGGTGGLSGIVGSGAGGTSVAAGGVGTGTNGLVSSTLGIGAPITSFDPVVVGTLQMDRDYAESTSILTPTPIINTNTGTANLSYLQGFHTGTDFSVGFNNTHITTNSSTNSYTPLLGSNFQARVTQELLQGFGFLPNTRFIRIAKNNREISDVAFRLQIITTVDQIENLYWNLVYAYENVKVQQEALAFAQSTLEDNKKQVQMGTLAPIQVVSAQSTVSTDQQNLILARTNLELQVLLMKNALSRNLQDPILAAAEVIPTSTMSLPDQEPVTPTEDLIQDALGHRAELSESRIDLNSRELNNKAVRNAMLPTLNLYAYYGGSGIGGDVNPAVTFNPNNAAPPFRNGGPVGYAATLQQLVNSTAPDKGVGISLNIPVLNRTAQADQVRAELEYRRHRYACSNSKTRFASRYKTPSSTCSKIAPVSTPPRPPSITPARPWTRNRKNLPPASPVLRRFCRTRRHSRQPNRTWFPPRPPTKKLKLSWIAPLVFCWTTPASSWPTQKAARSRTCPTSRWWPPVKTRSRSCRRHQTGRREPEVPQQLHRAGPCQKKRGLQPVSGPVVP
jgi:outer membrane protein TolC